MWKQIKSWWRLQFHVWRQPYDRNIPYIWVVNKDVNYSELEHAMEKIVRFRRGTKKDLVVTNNFAKLIPANEVILTMAVGEHKNKTELLKWIKAALGPDDDWRNIAEINIKSDIIEVKKYYAKPGR